MPDVNTLAKKPNYNTKSVSLKDARLKSIKEKDISKLIQHKKETLKIIKFCFCSV